MEGGFDEAECMATDPFADCFGSGEVVLSDKIVTAGKAHEASCNICGGDIAKGERHRVRVERLGGEIDSYRWCGLCCHAMAIAAVDAGRAWEARCGLCVGGGTKLTPPLPSPRA